MVSVSHPDPIGGQGARVAFNAVVFSKVLSTWRICGLDLSITDSQLGYVVFYLRQCSATHNTRKVEIRSSTFGKLNASTDFVQLSECNMDGSMRLNTTLLEIKDCELSVSDLKLFSEHSWQKNQNSQILEALSSKVNLTNVNIQNTSSNRAGGIFADNSIIKMTNVTVSVLGASFINVDEGFTITARNNASVEIRKSSLAGAVAAVESHVTITETHLSSSFMISIGGSLTVIRSVFNNGGFFVTGGEMDLPSISGGRANVTNCNFNGYFMMMVHSQSMVYVQNSKFQNVTMAGFELQDGSILHLEGSTISNCTFAEGSFVFHANTSAFVGGCVWEYNKNFSLLVAKGSKLTVTNTKFQFNTVASTEGSLINVGQMPWGPWDPPTAKDLTSLEESTVVLQNTNFTDHTANFTIFDVQSSSVSMTGCRFERNSVKKLFHVENTRITLTDCLIQNNTSLAPAGLGSSLCDFVHSRLILQKTTIQYNVVAIEKEISWASFLWLKNTHASFSRCNFVANAFSGAIQYDYEPGQPFLNNFGAHEPQQLEMQFCVVDLEIPFVRFEVSFTLLIAYTSFKNGGDIVDIVDSEMGFTANYFTLRSNISTDNTTIYSQDWDNVFSNPYLRHSHQETWFAACEFFFFTRIVFLSKIFFTPIFFYLFIIFKL